MQLDTPVSVLTGVGPVVKKGLEQLKIKTVGDLLCHLPRRFENYSAITRMRDIRPNSKYLSLY